MNILSQIEIEQIEHQFLGKIANRIRTNSQNKKDAKNDRKLARINARQQGGGVIGKIGSALQGVFAAKNADTAMMDERGVSVDFNNEAELAAQQAKQRQTMIIIAIVIIVVVVLLIMMMKKK